MNFSLQQLCQSLYEKRSQAAEDKKKTDQLQTRLFGPIPSSLSAALEGENGSQVQSYLQLYRSSAVRAKVLANRLADTRDTVAKAAADKTSGELVLRHLQTEQAAAEERIKQAQYEGGVFLHDDHYHDTLIERLPCWFRERFADSWSVLEPPKNGRLDSGAGGTQETVVVAYEGSQVDRCAECQRIRDRMFGTTSE